MILKLHLIILWVLSVLCGSAFAAEPSKPNILIVLADDLGHGDLSCYGATKVSTPNIDRLAKEGMRFTDAHSPSAVCSPTRYALLTGQYAFRHPKLISGVLHANDPLVIAPGKPTLAPPATSSSASPTSSSRSTPSPASRSPKASTTA